MAGREVGESAEIIEWVERRARYLVRLDRDGGLRRFKPDRLELRSGSRTFVRGDRVRVVRGRRTDRRGSVVRWVEAKKRFLVHLEAAIDVNTDQAFAAQDCRFKPRNIELALPGEETANGSAEARGVHGACCCSGSRTCGGERL